MSTKKLLAVVTNIATLGPDGPPNGTFLSEIAHALHEFEAAGIDYEIASPQGSSAPFYGVDESDRVSAQMLKAGPFRRMLENTQILSTLDPKSYRGIFFPGGYGLLWDLVEDPDVQRITAEIYDSGGIVSAVCHGPAALLNIGINGAQFLQGRHVTAFAREEEVDYGTIDAIPFVLEERLLAAGAIYSKAPIWQEHVETDGRLITGQNPGSAHAVGRIAAELMLAL
jgi:putative intracellular protease/amidase